MVTQVKFGASDFRDPGGGGGGAGNRIQDLLTCGFMGPLYPSVFWRCASSAFLFLGLPPLSSRGIDILLAT